MRIALKRRKKEVQRHQGNTGAMVFTLLLAIFCVIFLFTVDNIKLLRPSEQVSHIIISVRRKRIFLLPSWKR